MKDEEKILIGITVQQFQPVTVFDVAEKTREYGFDIMEEDIVYVLENMQRRDLLSIAYQSKNNRQIKSYAMAKPIFKKIPETAHIKDLLPTLTKNKEAKKFLELLEGTSSDTKKAKELGYRDYKQVKLTWETIAPIVGGSVNKPDVLTKEVEDKVLQLEKKAKKSSEKKSGDDEKSSDDKIGSDYSVFAYFNRSPDGKLVYTPNQVRQYFMKNLRVAGISTAAIDQIYWSSASINQNGHKFYVEQWAIIVGGQGRGIKSAEALPAGLTIETEFVFPFTGTKITTSEQLKSVLEFICERGVGFSSYSKKFGKCKLVGFEVKNLPWEK